MTRPELLEWLRKSYFIERQPNIFISERHNGRQIIFASRFLVGRNYASYQIKLNGSWSELESGKIATLKINEQGHLEGLQIGMFSV
jgi:hypothetical protein